MEILIFLFQVQVLLPGPLQFSLHLTELQGHLCVSPAPFSLAGKKLILIADQLHRCPYEIFAAHAREIFGKLSQVIPHASALNGSAVTWHG